jgi:hypothetical protein
MPKHSRGQGAMEYLMTYGWAILVVMIVGVAIWQMGFFSSHIGRTTVVDFKYIKPLNPNTIQLTSDEMSIVFMNGVGDPITITDMKLDFTYPTTADCSAATYSVSRPDPATTAVLSLGETMDVGYGQTFEAIVTGCTGVAGESYDVAVTISYRNNVGGFNDVRMEEGKIMGPITS